MEMWTDNHYFGLRISDDTLDRILSIARQAKNGETGGILVGYYTPELHCAIVTDVTGPPADSATGPSWFKRGVRGLNSLLQAAWRHKHRRYYLGEWHFHPNAKPNPSGTDVSEMLMLASDENYHCPEPLLLIMGGNPLDRWCLRAFVLPQGNCLEMWSSGNDSGVKDDG
jgi:integrative and conjugative element protein (TIGR02256 family)